MPLIATGINPLSAAIRAAATQSQVDTQFREFTLNNAFRTTTALLDNTLSRASLAVLPPPVDFTQTVNPATGVEVSPFTL